MFDFVNITPKNYLKNIEHLATTRQPIVLTPSTDSLHAEHSTTPISTTKFVQDKILNVYAQAQQSGCDMPMRDFLQSVLHGCEEIKYLLKGLESEYATHAADATHSLEKPRASLHKQPKQPSLSIPSSSKKSNTSNLRTPLAKAQKNGVVKKYRAGSQKGKNTYTPEFLNHMHLMVAGPYNFYISANKILKLYKIPSCAEILHCITQETVAEEYLSLSSMEKKKKLVQFLLKKCVQEHQAGRGIPLAGKSVFQYTISLEKQSLVMLIHFSEDKHFNALLHNLMFNIVDIYLGKTAEECYEHIKILCNTPPICTDTALKESIETFDTSMFNMAGVIPHAGESAQHFAPIYLEAPNVIQGITHAKETEASLQSLLPQDPYYGNVPIEQTAGRLNVTEEEHLQYIFDLLDNASLPTAPYIM